MIMIIIIIIILCVTAHGEPGFANHARSYHVFIIFPEIISLFIIKNFFLLKHIIFADN